MGKVEPDEEGLLAFNDFDRLFRIIQKHATFRICAELEADAEQRISLLKKGGILEG